VIALVNEGETTEAAAALGLGVTVMSSGDEGAIVRVRRYVMPWNERSLLS